MRGARSDDGGFTLLEVLLGLSLLSYIALSVVSLAVLSVHLSDLTEERSLATSLASDRIQRITASGFQGAATYQAYALPEETAAAGPPQTLTTDYGDVPGYPEFRRVVELNYDVPVAGMLSVETRVSWKHLGKDERTHTMVTYVHPGLN